MIENKPQNRIKWEKQTVYFFDFFFQFVQSNNKFKTQR